jgi:hypothetical protein
MSMNREERKVFKHKLRNRRYRARQAVIADGQTQIDIEPYTPPVVAPQVQHRCLACGAPACVSVGEGKHFCSSHGHSWLNAVAPAKTPSALEIETAFSSVPERQRNMFDTSTDPLRPSWWPGSGEIELALDPLTVLRQQRAQRGGNFVPTVIEYSQETGHIDIAKQQAELEEQKYKDVGR